MKTRGLFSRSMLLMLVLVVLIGLGEKMAERFLPLFLLALGGSTFSVGLLNALDNMLSALYSFPGGYVAHRFGYKKSLLFFTLIAMLGYLVVILSVHWHTVLVASVFFIAWTAVTLPAVMGLVNRTVDKNHRVMGVSIHSLVRRIPMAAGPVLGGAIIGLYASRGLSEEAARIAGIRTAFAVALVLGLAAMAAVHFFMPADKPESSAPRGLAQLFRQMDPGLKNLLLSDILIRFAEQIPYAFVVVWVVKYNLISEFRFGLLTAIEMGVALLVYIPVAFLADRHGGKKPFILMTFCFFTAFPLVLLFSRSFGMLTVAFIIRGLKEFGEPTRKALIMELSPEDCKAASFGAYYLIRDVTVGLAALSSSFLWDLSPAVNFTVAALCGAIGTLLYALFGRDVTTAPPRTPCMPGATGPLPDPSRAGRTSDSPR